jgi:Carboxypeptidase regulatory-like domain/TonB dependent receptor
MSTGAPLLRLKHSTVLVLSILFLAVCSWPTRGAAQEVTATINGTITDPAGNVVANVDVTATDLDRGTVWPTKTNLQGFYNLTRLPVGRYSVRVSAPGFQTAVETTPDLQLNQIAAVNIKLIVGRNSETVQVTSTAPLLQTESAEVSTVIDAQANVDLPLASRNYLQLTLLAPGVVTPNPFGPSSFTTGQTTGQNERPEINGNRFTTNDYVLDGMDNNEMASNFIAYTPQPDAIQEFNLISQNAPADFGNYMGGIISASTKAGTNSLHGSAFEFFRNNVLNANQWYDKLETPAIPRAALRWNEFGAAVGGAILKNKLFFFADYQGERFDTPTSGSPFTVFTAKERTGDFSELLTLPTPVVIKNPQTGQPYPGNVITSGLSPAALSIVNSQYYPTPLNGNLSNNAIDYSHTYTDVDQGDGRVDWAVNDRNHVFGRFSKEQLVNPTTNSYQLAYNTSSNAGVWNTVADYTRAINNNLVNDARFGISYININNGTDTNNVNVSQFGIPGLPSSILPALTFSKNYLVGGVGGSQAAFGNKNSFTVQADTVIQYQDVLNWTHGKHNFRFGFQGWRLRMNGFFPGNSGLAGNFDFDGQYSGAAESDFLLGLPDSVQVGQPGPVWGQRGNIFAAFFQDDWKVTPKLVLNLGLRYENHTPWYETNNKQVNFDPLTGNLELPGQNGNNRALYDSYNGISNYQPRIGISYLLFPKTVIRAGYAMSEFMEGTGLSLRLPQNPPFSIESQANYGSLPYPTTTLDEGFTPISSTDPCTFQGLENASPACYSGALLLSWDRHVQPARSNQWNLFVQHQLTNTMTFQAGYVGQQNRHLVVPKQLNEYYVAPNGISEPSLFFADNQNLLGLGALPLATYSEATANYNALQSSLQGRLNHGLSYQLSYTWSHCLTNATGFFGESGSAQQSSSQDAWYQNLYDAKADYGSCYFNVKNVFSGYAIYDLPFGRGRAYGARMNSVANAVAGDWRVSVIPTFRGGFPLTLGANDPSGTPSNPLGINSFGERPDCNGPPVVYGKSNPLPASLGGGYQWFSPAPYSQPTSGYGTCSISSVYGPGERDIDLGISKSFPVREQQNVEFRTEFINAFNHTILNSPNTGLGSSLGIINGSGSSQGARNIQFALKYNF